MGLQGNLMLKETNIRSFAKGFSWRIVATITTIIIVYLFFGRLDLAIAAGAIEWISKIFLFWIHERVWLKIRWGKKRITPFNLWMTGLPLSGKTSIADKVFEKLNKNNFPLQRIDSKDVRLLIPDIGYSRNERINHIKRIGYLVKTLHGNYISTICSFVSPYRKARKAIREMVKNNVFVYVKADIETCKLRDYKGVYKKAINGEIKNFTGINDVFEEPQNADIIIDTDLTNIDQASEKIVNYLKKHHLK